MTVVHAGRHAAWSWQQLRQGLLNRNLLRGQTSVLRGFAPWLPWMVGTEPLALLDFDDPPVLAPHVMPLVRRAALIFKRELPPDRWRLLAPSAGAASPPPAFRDRARWAGLLDKVRPLPLGLPLGRAAQIPPVAAKAQDLFFAGGIDRNSTLRTRGIQELLALREAGFAIDLPDQPVPPREFLDRCAAAWLAWSPEGLGWDCFRHYEAAACGTVPLMNVPSIERHAPLRSGVHGLFYDSAPGGLTAAFHRAIADRPRLLRMGAAARAHVLASHTPEAICTYIVDSLAREITARRGLAARGSSVHADPGASNGSIAP